MIKSISQTSNFRVWIQLPTRLPARFNLKKIRPITPLYSTRFPFYWALRLQKPSANVRKMLKESSWHWGAWSLRKAPTWSRKLSSHSLPTAYSQTLQRELQHLSCYCIPLHAKRNSTTGKCSWDVNTITAYNVRILPSDQARITLYPFHRSRYPSYCCQLGKRPFLASISLKYFSRPPAHSEIGCRPWDQRWYWCILLCLFYTTSTRKRHHSNTARRSEPTYLGDVGECEEEHDDCKQYHVSQAALLVHACTSAERSRFRSGPDDHDIRIAQFESRADEFNESTPRRNVWETY